MSARRQIRWADVVQMLYKCFVFTGKPVEPSVLLNDPVFKWRPLMSLMAVCVLFFSHAKQQSINSTFCYRLSFRTLNFLVFLATSVHNRTINLYLHLCFSEIKHCVFNQWMVIRHWSMEFDLKESKREQVKLTCIRFFLSYGAYLSLMYHS